MESWKFVPAPAVNGGGRPRSQAEVDQGAQRERVFVAFFDTATYPMIAESLDGTITAWNPAAERLYGYSAPAAIGRRSG
jgi:PAS domain-containing protein